MKCVVVQCTVLIWVDFNLVVGGFVWVLICAVFIKSRKAVGLDEMSPELWKTILLRLCNTVYCQNTMDKWTKGCILLFPKKGDFGITKNNSGINPTKIVANIYTAILFNRIRTEVWRFLRKNQNGFLRNQFTTSQILTIWRIIEGVDAKNLEATLFFVDFFLVFDSIHRGKQVEIFIAYENLKETVTSVMMHYKDSNAMVHSLDGDFDFFEIIIGVLQEYTLVPFLFIICLDYLLQMSLMKKMVSHTHTNTHTQKQKQKQARRDRSSHRSISFRESMLPPSDSAIHWPIRDRVHWFLLPLKNYFSSPFW